MSETGATPIVPVDIGSRAEPPFARLPEPATLFRQRAQRYALARHQPAGADRHGPAVHPRRRAESGQGAKRLGGTRRDPLGLESAAHPLGEPRLVVDDQHAHAPSLPHRG